MRNFKSLVTRVLAVILSVLIILPSVPATAAESAKKPVLTFADMPNNWATEALENAVKNGLINGYIENGKNLIKPNGVLRRNEMLTIVTRAFGAQVIADLSAASDIPEGIWYEDSIGKAVQMGITDLKTKMSPTKTVTREEVFFVLARAFKLKTTDNYLDALDWFTDKSSISPNMRNELNEMVKTGYLQGYPDGTLRPKASITRAEFATIMNRLVQEYIYTPGEVEEVTDKGNVLIRAEGVTLKDLTVKGDLIIADGVGDGEVTLDGVRIEGRLVVRGGGVNSIIIKGSSSIDRIIVSRVDSEVRISVEGGAEVEYIYVDDGSDDVIVTGTVKTLEVVADDIKVVANEAKIENGIITGENASLVVSKDSEVKTLNISADNVKVTGEGTLTEVKVEEKGSNAVIETANTKIEVEKGAEGVKGGGGIAISGGSTSTNNNTGTGTTGQPPVSGGFIPVMPSYTPISSVSVSGTATVGQTLSTVLSPASAVAAYQWQRSPSSDGTYADIQNATSGTYTLTASDADYYIRVRVTGTGLYTGTLNSNPSSLVKQKTYTVTFKDWDGKTLDTQTVEQGKNASAPSALSRPGYTFEGWDKACTNIKSDLTITAQYSINKYTITFNTNGGTEVESITQDYGTQVIPPSAPEKEGYRFIGWNPEMPTVMPSENITLVAQYSVPSQLSQVVLPDALIKTAYFDITLDDFIIYDQKGELVNLIEEYWIEILGDSELTISNSIISIASGTTRIYAPNVIGYYDLVFLLKDPNGNVLSTQSTTIQVVNSTDIISYQIEPISNVYAKIETNGTLADKTAYYKPINIVGRTSSGISVQLVYDPATGLPADILMITSTNNSFSFVVHNGKKHLTTTYDSTASSISTTIKIFTGQGEVGSTTVTASSVPPSMHNVYFEQTSITLSRLSGVTKNFLDYLKAKDQYGVNYVLSSANIYYMTTNSSIISVDNTTDTFTLVATGACTLRAYFAATDRTVEMLVNVSSNSIPVEDTNYITSITGYETSYIMTYGSTNPLPATVTAVYQDGNTASVAVAWGSFPTTVEGTYDVTGTIEGFGTITIKVTLTKTLMVTDAYPTGTREIYVTFNMPVPTTTAVTCKFGAAVLAASSLTWTWSSDRKSVTIGRGYNFTPGDYSVTVSASTKEFRIEAEKLVEIDIAANTVYPQTGNQDLNVTFYNQYGLAMNPLTMNLQLSAVCPQQPAVSLNMSKTATSVTISGAETLVVGNSVNVLVIDNATAEVAIKVLQVASAPVISSFTFGELTIADSATILLTGTHGHKMTVSAVDQYGNEYKLRTGNQDISSTISATTPLFITSTDPAVVDPALIEVDADGKLFFKPGAIGTKDGTVTLRVIAPMNPNMTPVSYSITVQKSATISSISVQGLSSTLRAGQWVPLIAYVYDQYNKPISMENINNLTNLGKLRIVSTNSVVIPNGTASDSITGIRYNTTTKVLEVYGASAGLIGISILYDNIIQATLTVNVEEAAAPSQLTAVNLPTIFQKHAYADMTLDNFTIYDQYYSLIGLSTGYRIEISGTTGLTVSNSVLTSTNGTTRITAPNTVGNYDLIFSLKDPSGNTLSTQSMVITVIDSAAVTSYQIEPISNVYARIETNGSLADKTAYYKPVNIIGRTINGINVQLVYDPATGLPADILMLTSTNSTFDFVVHNGKKHLTTTYPTDGTASSISTTIKIFTGQGEVGSTTVTASSVPPSMHNVYFEQTSITLSRSSALTKNFLDYLKAKDQYGVNYVLSSANIYYMTSNSSIISVDNDADTFTLVATGACTLKAYFASTDRTVEMNVNVTGDIINEERFAIEVTGSKTIKVTFAESQDITQTSFSLLKNSIEVSIANIQWELQNKILILSSDTLFEGGNYILNINTQSIGLTIESERATGLIIDSNIIFARSGFQDTNIHLVNQYGEKMSFGADNIIGETSLGTLSILDDTINIQISPSDIGKQIAIHVRYLPRNFELTTIVTVVEDQILSGFIFYGPIDLGEESRLYGRLTSGTEDNTLAFKAFDQYGNEIDITEDKFKNNYTFVTSGGSIGSIVSGKIILENLPIGTFSIRVILLSSGVVSELYTESVYARPALALFDVVIPEDIYVNEAVDCMIKGYDQYGDAMSVDTSILNITPLSLTVNIAKRVDAINKVTLTFGTKGAADLYFTVNLLTINQDIYVQPTKEVTSIVSIPITTQTILVGRSVTLNTDNVILNDQYSNIISVPAGYNWDLRILSESNPYGVPATYTDATVFLLAGTTITAQKEGVGNLRLTLYSGETYASTSTDYKEIIYDFELTAIDEDSASSYLRKPLNQIYLGTITDKCNVDVRLIGLITYEKTTFKHLKDKKKLL